MPIARPNIPTSQSPTKPDKQCNKVFVKPITRPDISITNKPNPTTSDEERKEQITKPVQPERPARPDRTGQINPNSINQEEIDNPLPKPLKPVRPARPNRPGQIYPAPINQKELDK